MIHTGKASLSIIDHLRDAGLVNSERGDWFEVDSDVADVYMSLLAKYPAQAQSDPTTCVTDSVSASNSLLGEQCVAMPGQLVLDLRLVEAIPIPSERVPWKELLAFREEHAEQLSRFRRHISELSQAIAAAESGEQVKSLIADSKDDIEHGANDLRKRMHTKGYDVVLASLKTLLDMKSPAAMATLASCIQGSGLASIPIIGWAGIVSYGLVNLGIQVHRGAKEYRELRAGSPYTYVVDAARRGFYSR